MSRIVVRVGSVRVEGGVPDAAATAARFAAGVETALRQRLGKEPLSPASRRIGIVRVDSATGGPDAAANTVGAAIHAALTAKDRAWRTR
jgi:hypothetical protein